MGECEYFKEDRKENESKEIRADRSRNIIVNKIPWCSHFHSPVTLERARSFPVVGTLLKCGGDLDKCQIPLEQLEDV